MTDKTDKTAAKPGDEMKPAKNTEASGALIEPDVTKIDPSHPAVDANPRAGTPADSNRIDFNDPTLSQEEAVVQKLGEG